MRPHNQTWYWCHKQRCFESYRLFLFKWTTYARCVLQCSQQNWHEPIPNFDMVTVENIELKWKSSENHEHRIVKFTVDWAHTLCAEGADCLFIIVAARTAHSEMREILLIIGNSRKINFISSICCQHRFGESAATSDENGEILLAKNHHIYNGWRRCRTPNIATRV